ncbi:MAG: Ig-like domain-containing protein, partial [Chloroflexi bacterium]|nr:Ig-like domain-containing protein [Chloroflexota bacterium]
VNDPPLAVDDTAVTSQDTAVVIAVLNNDSDVDGDTLTITNVTQPGNGLAAVNPDGTISYTPDSGFNGSDSLTYTVSDGNGGLDTATVAITVTPATGSCELYPIALHVDTLAGVQVGDVIEDIWNGTQPGNFGWLTWTGDTSVPVLAASLTPPGNSHTYVNPNDPNDHVVSVGDWVEGKPGVSNARQVRDALDLLTTVDIVVPIWDASQGSGAQVVYRIAGFARVRLMAYNLAKSDYITARFLGYTSCSTVGVINSGLLAGGAVEIASSPQASSAGLPRRWWAIGLPATGEKEIM